MSTAEAFTIQDDVIEQIVASNPSEFARAIAIVELHARTGREFTINDCREAFAQAEIKASMFGAVFKKARDRRLVRIVGHMPSTNSRSRGDMIAVYLGAHVSQPAVREEIVVPAHRAPSGRFAKASAAPSLEDSGDVILEGLL